MQSLLIQKIQKEIKSVTDTESLDNFIVDTLKWFICNCDEYVLLDRASRDKDIRSNLNNILINHAVYWYKAWNNSKVFDEYPIINQAYSKKIINDIYILVSPIRQSVVKYDRFGVNITKLDKRILQSTIDYTIKDREDIINLFALWLSRHEEFFNMCPQASKASEPIASAVHPSEILVEEFLEPLQMTYEQFSEKTGIDVTAIELSIINKVPINASTALAYSKALGTSAEFWLNLQSSYELSTLNTIRKQ